MLLRKLWNVKKMQILYNILHPIEFSEKIRWKVRKKKLKFCGQGSSMGMNFVLRGEEYISIGDNSHFGKNNQLSVYREYRGKKTGRKSYIHIGNNVSIMDNCHVSCANLIEIGDGVLFGDNVFVTDNYHGDNTYSEIHIPPIERELYIGEPVKIGDNVWIGRNVCIMPGVCIGRGSVVGANSVVTKDIPEYCVAVGAPARIIKKIEYKEKS